MLIFYPAIAFAHYTFHFYLFHEYLFGINIFSQRLSYREELVVAIRIERIHLF